MRAAEVELSLAEIGSGQWGLITAAQARQAGLNRAHLFRLHETGVLIRLTHGVYALRGSMSAEHLELRAAWLALEPVRSAADRLDDGATGPVVSHASAAVLHGLGDLDADHHEFTTATRKQTRRHDVQLHLAALSDADITLHAGLPVTTPARTILDLLAGGHDGGHVAGVLAAAVHQHRLDPAQLTTRLEPFAARFGFRRRDGRALLEHLLELGGVSEQVTADRLAAAARAARIPLGELIATSTVGDRALQSQLAGLHDLAAAAQMPTILALADLQAPSAAMAAALADARGRLGSIHTLLAAAQAPTIFQAVADLRLPVETIEAALAGYRQQLAPLQGVLEQTARQHRLITGTAAAVAQQHPRSVRESTAP